MRSEEDIDRNVPSGTGHIHTTTANVMSSWQGYPAIMEHTGGPFLPRVPSTHTGAYGDHPKYHPHASHMYGPAGGMMHTPNPMHLYRDGSYPYSMFMGLDMARKADISLHEQQVMEAHAYSQYTMQGMMPGHSHYPAPYGPSIHMNTMGHTNPFRPPPLSSTGTSNDFIGNNGMSSISTSHFSPIAARSALTNDGT
jgi:hypothetical protein